VVGKFGVRIFLYLLFLFACQLVSVFKQMDGYTCTALKQTVKLAFLAMSLLFGL
jgi:hypothetical protein